MDYKEYSKLRSIARKRIERAAAAGLAPYVYIPTVKEVKASDNPEQFMYNVRRFLETGTTVRNIRKAPETKFPVLDLPQLPPGVAKKQPMTPEQRRARKNLQNRRSKAKRAVERAAETEKERDYHVRYLKALWTMADKWREKGVDIGNWLVSLTPKQAKEFVNYIDYRFSQGDFTMQYVIDTFSKNYGAMRQREYSFSDIEKDFSQFIIDQQLMKKRKKNTNEYGFTQEEIMDIWDFYAGNIDRAGYEKRQEERKRKAKRTGKKGRK